MRLLSRGILTAALAALLTPVAPPLVDAAPPAPVEPEAGVDGVQITRLETSAYPSIMTELTVPATLLDGVFAPQDVTVLENGAAIAADVTVVPPGSLEVVLLFDTSGSMNEGNAIAFARFAAEQFLAYLPEGTQVGIVGFGTTPSLVSPLTANTTQLLDAVRGMRANGKTSLYDGVVFGQQLFSGSTDDRQFVILSDGGDTSSNASIDDALDASSDVRTSVIELVTSESDHDALVRLAEAGNGSVSAATDGVALAEVFQDVAEDLVNRVRVTFATGASGDTTYAFQVATPLGVVEATRTVTLPIATTPSSVPTSAVPATTVSAPPTSTGSAATPSRTAPRDRSTADSIGRGGRDAEDPPFVLLVLGAVGFFAGSSVLLALAAIRPPDSRTARRRLGAPEPPSETSVTARVTQATDRWLDRDGRGSRLSMLMDTAGVALRPGELVVLVLSGGIVLALALFLAIGPFGLLLGPPLASLGAWTILRVKQDRRRRTFGEQLPDALQLVVSSLRAGYGLPQALASVAERSDEPTRGEFQRVQFEARIGRDPSEALHAVADRMASTDFEWVVAAIDINREIGGELAQVLDHVAETIRERARLRRQIQTLTAEGRLSAYVLTALPFVMFGVLTAMNPGYFEPLTYGVGLMLVVLAGVLLLAGWFWMRRMIKAQL
jgi:Flp pilus assembly protein TadB